MGLGIAACGGKAESNGNGGGGTGGALPTGTSTATGTASDTAASCPAELPALDSPCADATLECDYPDSPCAPHASCRPSYGPAYGELLWHHSSPSKGSACTSTGQICRSSTAQFDSETLYTVALCSSSGWVVHSSLCGDSQCGSCPTTLPAEGSACDPGPEMLPLAYGQCTFVTDEACGPVIAWLSCDAGAFTIMTSGCE